MAAAVFMLRGYLAPVAAIVVEDGAASDAAVPAAATAARVTELPVPGRTESAPVAAQA
jgi:hypothetical protein